MVEDDAERPALRALNFVTRDSEFASVPGTGRDDIRSASITSCAIMIIRGQYGTGQKALKYDCRLHRYLADSNKYYQFLRDTLILVSIPDEIIGQVSQIIEQISNLVLD